MNIIVNNYEKEFIIKKSKFIVLLCKVNSKADVKNKIDDIKLKYKKATHYCYAYKLDNSYIFNDDGEPSGSAGLPIYNAIDKYNLVNVLCVVIRYFGGVKLGLGLLSRTYFKVVNSTLKETEIIENIIYKIIKINFNYDSIDKIDYIVKDYIMEKEFNENISYTLKIPDNLYESIIEKIKDDIKF